MSRFGIQSIPPPSAVSQFTMPKTEPGGKTIRSAVQGSKNQKKVLGRLHYLSYRGCKGVLIVILGARREYHQYTLNPKPLGVAFHRGDERSASRKPRA